MTAARIYSILIAKETAADEAQTVAFGVQRHSLTETRSIVLYRDVLDGYVGTAHLEREGAESTYDNRFVVGNRHEQIGVVVVCDDGGKGILTTNLDIGQMSGYDDFLMVRSSFNVNNFMVVHKSATHLYRLADSAELSCAVLSHYYGIGVVELVVGNSRGG